MNQPPPIHVTEQHDSADREHRALPPGLSSRDDPAELVALWTMTRKQRVEEMWAGRLTLSQLTDWSSRRPREVPRLGHEFAWLVMRTPEWADATEHPKDNLIQLPRRSERRAAA